MTSNQSNNLTSKEAKLFMENKSMMSFTKNIRKSNINIYSQFLGRYGIARHARAMAEMIGVYFDGVNNAIGNGKITITQNLPQAHFGDLNEHLLAMYSEEPENTKISLQFWYPNTYERVKDAINIGYFIFEYDIIPKEYVVAINKMDAVCTASEWGSEVLRSNGIKVPIIVFPVGGLCSTSRNSNLTQSLSDLSFGAQARIRRAKIFRYSDPFKFYHIGKFEERKGTKILIKAFNEFSRGKNDYELHLHITNPHSHLTPYDFMNSIVNDLSYPTDNIILHEESYDPINILDYDCGVFPSLAEGVGLPIVEAMTCGVPTITCSNSGITQYANEDNCLLITDLEIVPVYDKQFFPIEGEYGTWNRPSVESVIAKMELATSDRQLMQAVARNASGMFVPNIHSKAPTTLLWSNIIMEFREDLRKLGFIFQ